jgi:hypothetical protein
MTTSARMCFVAALSLDVISFSSSQAPTSAPAAAPQSAQRMLEVADFVELPVTGDKSDQSHFRAAGAGQECQTNPSVNV